MSLPELASIQGLNELEWGERLEFLGVSSEAFDPAAVIILPVPYEATVTYMRGTARGPRAILEASAQIELYDDELDSEPYEVSTYTLPSLKLPDGDPKQAHSALRRAVAGLIGSGKFLILLGGEHSISAEPILEHAARLGSSELSVLQLDAHADLRPEYGGTPYSHACVMHRVYEVVNLVQVGTRSLTRLERELIRSEHIRNVSAREMRSKDWIGHTLEALGEHVYVTLDVDYFDPAVVPSTGTPEPGGGQWEPTLELLRRVFEQRQVVGLDVVELAPIQGVVAPDFLVAKLVYKLIGYYSAGSRSR